MASQASRPISEASQKAQSRANMHFFERTLVGDARNVLIQARTFAARTGEVTFCLICFKPCCPFPSLHLSPSALSKGTLQLCTLLSLGTWEDQPITPPTNIRPWLGHVSKRVRRWVKWGRRKKWAEPRAFQTKERRIREESEEDF